MIGSMSGPGQRGGQGEPPPARGPVGAEAAPVKARHVQDVRLLGEGHHERVDQVPRHVLVWRDELDGAVHPRPTGGDDDSAHGGQQAPRDGVPSPAGAEEVAVWTRTPSVVMQGPA